MAKRLIHTICLMAVILLCSGEAWSQQSFVHPYATAQTQGSVALSDGVELTSTSNTIVVKTNHRIQMQVFTILGQLISRAYLNPGTSELRVNSRGIYIVRVGNEAQRIAVK